MLGNSFAAGLPAPNPSNATCNIALPPASQFPPHHSKRTRYPFPRPPTVCSVNSLSSPFLFATITRLPSPPHAPRHTRTRNTSIALALPWQTGDLTAAEAAAGVVTSAGAAAEEEDAGAVEGAEATGVDTTRAATSTAARAAASRGPRRRTSSTCQSTTTSRSPSSSTAAARVRFPNTYLPTFTHDIPRRGYLSPVGEGWPNADHELVRVTVTGVLKGYDPLMNLVLDEAKETMRDDEGKETTRSLGLTVARGTLIVLISPVDGSEEIANPFAQADDD